MVLNIIFAREKNLKNSIKYLNQTDVRLLMLRIFGDTYFYICTTSSFCDNGYFFNEESWEKMWVKKFPKSLKNTAIYSFSNGVSRVF